MSKRGKEKKRDIIPITTNIITTVTTTTTTTTTKEIITNKNCTKYYAVNFETTMREWLLLFIVLATLQMGIVQVASTFSQLSSTFNSIELQRQQNQIREQVKTSLLNSLFKMNRPPKIDRSKIYIPDEMLKQWRDITGKDLKHEQNITRQLKTLPKNYNTIRSFTHKESKIDDRFPHHHRYRLYFDVKSIPADEKVKKAELKLTCDSISEELMPFHIAQRTRYRILVYDIVRVGVKGVRSSQHWLIDSKTVSLSSKTTISFDVQKAVDRWLATPNKNYGLFVEVHTTDVEKPAPHNHVRLRRSIGEPEHKWRHKQPVLITYTSDNHRVSRSKRTKMGRRKSRNETCSRHSLYIDFEDVGWNDWIVAPNSYDAFYCHGECPYALAEHLNSTNHAVIQTLVHHSYPEKVPKVCCVPTELEGISMLYLNDQNTVVLKNYQDMAVVGCGCQ